METNELLSNGTLIGHFEIRGVLGIGGFGVTYKAWDTQLERWVAIKELLPAELALRDASTQTVRARTGREEEYQYAVQRFLDEARALARFSHPNIVRVVQFLEHNGTAYLVMEFEEGESLGARLKPPGTKLDEAEIKRIFIPILKGLAQVHKAGFLHRDIKPGNIYLRENGEPVLIDFGAARQAIGEHSRSVTGIVSAGYAPPEQYTSDSKKQGPWTDIYALGATLYRCISGKDPIDSPTRRESLHEEEDDPLIAAIEAGQGSYSPELLELIDQCLILSFRKRPQQAAAVLKQLVSEQPPGDKAAEEPRTTPLTQLVSSDEQGQDFRSRKKSTPDKPQAPVDYKTDVTQETAQEPDAPAEKARLKPGRLRAILIMFGILGAIAAALWSLNPSRVGLEFGAVFRDPLASGGKGPTMVVLPTGSFRMGSNKGGSDERPVHRVHIDQKIAMMQYEVTIAEYDRYVKASGKKKPNDEGWGRGSRPVINIAWIDALGYAKWLGEQTGKQYRLPSEAEWEYAARAGTSTTYSWGDDIGRNRANCASCGSQWDASKTAPVGSFKANAFGLYDMHGNVWEWVQDCWNDSYAGAPTDGSAWESGDCESRVLRGGSWDGKPARLRSANRNYSLPGYRNNGSGFRLVQDLSP